MRKIQKLKPTKIHLPSKKRVAAYARISLESGRLIHSLSAQISHYSDYIQKHSGWEYVGVYADSGETGTKAKRDEFQRLLTDCEAGKIDIVLTKSISRFARNTVDLLQTVRRLTEIGVEVRFEREGINSASAEGELMLTILASFAQEESRSLSENVKWAIRKGFEDGKPISFQLYGYRWNEGKVVIHPEEAEVVRLIFELFLNGLAVEGISHRLAEMGIKSPKGAEKFSSFTLQGILQNEKYMGILRLQKYFVEDHISHKLCKNNGELPMYIIENSHDAIISKEIFEAVQAERLVRKGYRVKDYNNVETSVFIRKIRCGKCGGHFRRHSIKLKDGSISLLWKCSASSRRKGDKCFVRYVPDAKIRKAATEVLGLDAFDDAVFCENVSKLVIPEDFIMEFHLTDGRVESKCWECTVRKDQWTPELRKKNSERARKNNAKMQEGRRRERRRRIEEISNSNSGNN